MIEVELKALVPDLEATRARVEAAGAVLRFAGRLEDQRYDTEDRAIGRRDHVLRLRVYREHRQGTETAALDWKGPTTYDSGYKMREELTCGLSRAEDFRRILSALGFIVTMAIDREIWQYELCDATVRFERYPRMDDLVEVEGAPTAIEAAIDALRLPRETFTSERLPDFVRRFEERTGKQAALSDAELTGTVRYDVGNA